jgi:hypothetical protein
MIEEFCAYFEGGESGACHIKSHQKQNKHKTQEAKEKSAVFIEVCKTSCVGTC